MKVRDCETCAHAQPFGGEIDNRCDAWECEYINRKEAIEAYKAKRKGEYGIITQNYSQNQKRNKGFVTKFKESTTAIVIETTYNIEIGE